MRPLFHVLHKLWSSKHRICGKRADKVPQMVQDSQIMMNESEKETRKASRIQHNPWRDRRVLLGVAVVLSSAVAGGLLWVTTTSSDTYWAVSHDVKAGQKVSDTSFRQVELTVPQSVRGTIVSTSSPRPRGVWRHDLAAGSVVPATAVQANLHDGQKLPLRVATGSLPSQLAPGSVVNIWVGSTMEGRSNSARRVLTDVKVVHVSRDVGAAERTVLVDVGDSGPTPEVVAAVAELPVTVVQVR